MPKRKRRESRSKYELTKQQENVLQPHTDGIIEFFNRYGLYIVCLLVLCYVLAYGYTCVRKYHSFSYYDYDLSIYNQVTWNTLHGKFMYSSIRENVYEKDGGLKLVGMYFKDHAPVILLFFLPIYAIFQSPLTLLMLQTVFLAGAAILLYLIAKRELHAGWGLVFSVIYLLYPALGYVNLFEFHPTCFVPFFLFAAFFFYRRGNYIPFIISLVLAMFCKEDMAITVFMFGVYAFIDFIRKRKLYDGLKWSIVPMAIGVFWAIIIYKIVAPMLNAHGYIYGEFFKEMGGTVGGIIKTAITRPVYTLKFITKVQPPFLDKPLFLLQLFLPVLFASFLSPLTLLIMIPQLFLYLASSKATTSTIYFQYTAAIIPVIFVSTVMGVKYIELKARWRQYWFIPASGVLFFGFLGCILWGTQFHLFSKDYSFIAANTTDIYDRIYISDHRDEIRQHMVDSIPKNSSVVSMFRFLAKLSSRQRVYSLHMIYSGKEDVTGLKYTVPENIEYALFDYGKIGFYTSLENPQTHRIMRDFIFGRKYGVEKVIDAFVLLKEGRDDLSPIFEILKEQPEPENKLGYPIEFNLQGQAFQYIGLIGTDVKLIDTDGFQQVVLTSYWQCINPAPTVGGEPARLTLNLKIYLANSNTPQETLPTTDRVYPITYAIYPAKVWKQGEIIKTTHYISIPPDVDEGKYNVMMNPILIDAIDPNRQQAYQFWGQNPLVAGQFEITKK